MKKIDKAVEFTKTSKNVTMLVTCPKAHGLENMKNCNPPEDCNKCWNEEIKEGE